MKRLLGPLGFLALATFVLLPLAQVIQLSFTNTLPRDNMARGALTLQNYANVFATERLADSLLNSTLYVCLNVALSIAVALPAAYAFSRFRFRGDRLAFFALLAFRVTPPVVLSLPVFLLFARVDLLNTPVGVALVHCVFNVPIAIWILESFISAVPREYDETAFLDGHSTPGFLVRRLIPVIAPGIGATAFFCFVFSWVEVVFARTLTITDGKPITTAITSLFGFRTDIGLVMAMTTLSLIPGLAMIWLVRNHISRGFTIRV
ncbi:carbohydrate ABC transporter permease [Maliponia aquimaris]|uniref:Trehalose transport system permease protein SugB n=1 Tax=Maliponia aquimaris TaxID=1673631 RepID=A0A238KGX3_9RHOB|nr:carbohydrate ABC transporter permease [Maliponia aquimaris]SMX42063.1 Trehalose transport system permease protein SugB [Maliponia aquimaris]